MRILVIAIGSYGDVLPLVGLARGLQQRRHPVTFFTNDHFGEVVRRAGLDFVALGSASDYDALANHPDLWDPYKGWRLIGSILVSHLLREAYEVIASQVVRGDTVMISSTLAFAARLVQETHCIPNATVHLSPGVFHSAYQAPRVPNLSMPDWLPVFFKRGVWSLLDYAVIDPIVKPNLNKLRGELGLKPASRIFHDWLHSPNLVLGLFPEWYATPQPDWPPQTRLTTFPLFDDAHDSGLPAEAQRFLDQGSAPVVFTPGSAMTQGRQFFEQATRACELLGRRGIFLTQYAEQVPSSLPNGVEYFPYVPLSRLLPHSAALVHHGGIGTCAQALRAGIPQLIQPLSFDQFDNASRVKALGVGGEISRRSFTGPRVARQLEHLLSSTEVSTACRAVAAHFARVDPIDQTCGHVESVLAQR